VTALLAVGAALLVTITCCALAVLWSCEEDWRP